MEKEVLKVLRAINSNLCSIAKSLEKIVKDTQESEEVEKTDSLRKD